MALYVGHESVVNECLALRVRELRDVDMYICAVLHRWDRVSDSVCGVKTLEDWVRSHRSATSKRVRLWLKARSRCPCQAEVSSLSCRSGTVSLCLNTRTCKDPYEVLLREQKTQGHGSYDRRERRTMLWSGASADGKLLWQCGGRLAWRRHWLCCLYVWTVTASLIQQEQWLASVLHICLIKCQPKPIWQIESSFCWRNARHGFWESFEPCLKLWVLLKF